MSEHWASDISSRLDPTPTLFSFAAEIDSNTLIVEVFGELDFATGIRLVDGLKPFMTSGVVVLLDLAGVYFMDSSGADMVSELTGMVDGAEGSVEITACSEIVEWVFGLLGLQIPSSCVGSAIP